ncbi:MAG: hypothetical protein GX349_05570 [Firmicutes bacterium]|nr:hypothetical protein [Bacillota bacterium]
MHSEEDLALRQGGKMLQLRQQFDSLYKSLEEQQGEKEQQTQQVLYQGTSHLKSLQRIGELEALLKELKVNLTSEGRGISGLPFMHLAGLAADLGQGLQREAASARKELQKSLQGTALSLLQGLEVGGEINRLAGLQELAKECEMKLQRLREEYTHPSAQGRDSGVGYTPQQQDH